MNIILREEFVDLHSQPIMNQLREEFTARYKNHKIVVKEALGKAATKKASLSDVSDVVEDETNIEVIDATQLKGATGDPIILHQTKKYRIAAYDIEFPSIPAKGQFDVKQVLQSPYFFH
jgi:DNA-directed RNA polymerase